MALVAGIDWMKFNAEEEKTILVLGGASGTARMCTAFAVV
jgi:hypothetical protein